MSILSRISASGAVLFFLAGPAAASVANPVVVELFTSQGCSSCPPANANLAALAGRPGILALSFGVTYWDKLGWKDTFAQPQFTARQVSYERRLGHDAPFTPQVVVNGSADVVGSRASDIAHLVSLAHLDAAPALSIDGDTLVVGAGRSVVRDADIWLVRYDPRVLEVPVAGGENEGVTLPHRNVVRGFSRLGTWSGRAEHFAITPATGGLATAVLVQDPGGGPILAAYMQ